MRDDITRSPGGLLGVIAVNAGQEHPAAGDLGGRGYAGARDPDQLIPHLGGEVAEWVVPAARCGDFRARGIAILTLNCRDGDGQAT